MKLNKILAAGVMFLATATMAHADISKGCEHVLLDSAAKFAAIDAVRDGYTESSIPDATAEQYVRNEIPAMAMIYSKGREAAVVKGWTRQHAERFIHSNNANMGNAEATRLANDAGSAAFMCGFDDAQERM